MGYLFECKDREIWSPSNRVALYLLSQVRNLEIEHQIASGLTESMADTIEVDFSQLRKFLIQIGNQTNLNNASLSSLMRGLCVHLLALLTADGIVTAEVAKLFPEEWVTEASLLARHAMEFAREQ